MLGLLVALAAGPALAQQRGDDDYYALKSRLDNLQNQIFRLQDKIAASGAGLRAGGGDPGSVAELSLRINSIEEQLRKLVGKVETMTFSMTRLKDRFTRFAEDAEFRFRELEGGRKALRRGAAGQQPGRGAPRNLLRAPGPGERAVASRPLGGVAGSRGGVDLNKAPPPAILGQIPATGEGAAVASAPGAGGDTFVPRISEAEAEYEKAYEALLRRRFEAAEAGFKNFLRRYPTHSLAGNAQYWLGETYYASGRYRDAASAFVIGYKKFAKSRKAPDSLLKLAMTLKRLGQGSETCATLDQLKRQFPRASMAVKNRARVERRNANC